VSTQKKIANAAADRLSSFQAKQSLETAKAARRKSDNRLSVMFGVGAVVLALVGQLTYFSFAQKHAPDASIAEARMWTGSMNVGDATLELELDGVNAPQAVANFISLSRSGFYEGVSCHRLVTDGIYVLQCGSPDGTGSGGPGYDFGPIENAPADDAYVTGSLAMARVGEDGNSMGSQFFIVYQDSTIPSDAAGGYTVFGKITSGLELLEPIISAGVSGGATDGAPALETLLSSIELR
jgi:peptidyl-prolyl cis-trans isomerase B (cyclophilin B)